jgi:hypothetical protein
MRTTDDLELVRDALTLLRVMRERLDPQPKKLDVTSDLDRAIKQLDEFLQRGDALAYAWGNELRLVIDMVLVVINVYLDFVRR